MPYVDHFDLDDLVVHDADAHVMETPEWFHDFADPTIRDRLGPIYDITAEGRKRALEEAAANHQDPAFRAMDAEQVMLRKNWIATGSFIKEDRPLALDLLGFATQLVFNTFANGTLLRAEHGDDLEVAYGMAQAHNRAIVDFCNVDKRLLPVGYVPLADFDRASAAAGEALALGCRALMIPSACPRGHSPSHIGLEPVWAQAAAAGVPIVFHVGGGGRLLDPAYFANGLPRVPDFHGGDGNFRSVDYLAIPYPVMQTLAVLIIDGVLDRHPTLRVGVIEQGAARGPGS